MCTIKKYMSLISYQSLFLPIPADNMSFIHAMNCTSDKTPCDCSSSKHKVFKSIQDGGSTKCTTSSVENHSLYDKIPSLQNKKSLYISKACKYSFIASDYTSPEGQKLLSIKVFQNPPESDISKEKNLLSKRSISEYFLCKNGVEKEVMDEKENSLLKSWQRSIFKTQGSIPNPDDINCDTENLKALDPSLNIVEEDIDHPEESELINHKQGLPVLESEACASSVADCLEKKIIQAGDIHKNNNFNPTVNFKVFDIESLSEAGEPCDSTSIENNAHFGLDEAWFIPSARHTFNAADISGSASAAQLSIASSFGDSSLPICKICHTAAKPEDPLISPCRCTGTLRYIHCGCLMKWLEICNKRSRKPPTCELCKYQFHWHKKFKVGQWQFPHCSWQDKILHTVFLLSVLIMIGCAIVTVLCFKQHRGIKAEVSHLELTQSEIITLICGALFFISFFLAMYVEIKARNTIYKLLLKFIYLNQQWYIDEYDKRKESSAIDV